MRLKGKLFITFGSVMLFALLVLGVIIHYSFTENTVRNGEEILRLKTEDFSHRLNNHLRRYTALIDHAIAPPFVSGETNTLLLKSVAKEQQLSEIQRHHHLINAILLATETEREIFIQVGHPEHEPPIQLPQGIAPSLDTPTIAAVADRLYLLWLIPLTPENRLLGIIELNRDEFETAVAQLFTIDQSILLLFDNANQLILTIDHAANLASSDFDFNQIIGQDNINKRGRKAGYVYPHTGGLLGNRLYLLIDNNFFLQELNSLKNRIIAGVFIVGWLLIWVILVFAHRISSPITKLSKITHDIMGLDYESDLAINSTDEIGELYRNFETMRNKLKDMITKDPLTNVYNRLFLMHNFEMAVLKATRLDHKLSCILLDIDFFKKINDTHGHQCGDQILIALGELILLTTRKYDTPARYGGEEFIFVLPDTDLDEAYAIAERLRKQMAALGVECNGRQVSCTISLGISCFDRLTANTPDRIINNADFALYEAKKGGRNQTVIHTPEMSTCHDCQIADSPLEV